MCGERVLVTGGAGFIGSNLAEALAEEKDVVILDDMVMSTTYTRDAAGMMRDILMKELPSGIYHVANSGYCSWFDFAKGIFEMLDIDANPTSALGSKSKNTQRSWRCECQVRRVWARGMSGWEDRLRGYLNEKGYFGSAGNMGR